MSDAVAEKYDTLCKDEALLIVDYLNGEFNSETNTAFEMHLSVCPDCVALLNTYRKTIFTVKSLYKNIPADLKKNVQRLMKEKIRGELCSQVNIEIHKH
jgi:anti-sigma factor RsiW